METMQLKLADMEDRSRRFKRTRHQVYLKWSKGPTQSSSSQNCYWSGSPPWVICRARSCEPNVCTVTTTGKKSSPCTLIFNTLQYTTRQLILHAATKSPLIMDGRLVQFSQRLHRQAMNMAQAKGVEFFLLYSSTLKGKAAGKTEVFQCLDKAKDFISCHWE